MQIILSYTSSPYFLLTLLALVIILLILVILLTLRLNKLFKGSSASSLEGRIHECLIDIKELKHHDELLAKHAEELDDRLKQAVRNVSALRFKAFESGASNQSFAISLLDEKGDGVVISSLHLRDRVSTYAKPVTNYASNYDLTEEERHVLNETKQAHIKK